MANAFSHEALFYEGASDFAGELAPFIREGVGGGEPVLVMVTSDKIDLLRDELGGDAEHVTFANMAEAGKNPGRIISAWNDFAAEHLAAGRSLRGVGEPIWAGRSANELIECQHHESMLNVAFGDAAGFRLVCPYDIASLPDAVLEEARRSHPLILDDDLVESSGYREVDAAALVGQRLPAPAAASEEVGFQQSTLDLVRRFVSEHATEAGLDEDRVTDIVMAANEAATNSILHGGGNGVLRVWQDGGGFVCEIRDRGRLDQPLVGRRRPDPETSVGGHGLWLAHQLCDLVQIRSRGSGTVVRLHMCLPA